MANSGFPISPSVITFRKHCYSLRGPAEKVHNASSMAVKIKRKRKKSDDGSADSGRQFNSKKFALSFGLKNGLRFHFDSETCLNFSVGNIKLRSRTQVQGVSGFVATLRPPLTLDRVVQS